MSRSTVQAITSDATGRTFYASDDGFTTVPFTYNLANGETANADLMPDEKSALYAFLSGDLGPMTNLILSLRPKTERGSISDEKRNDVASWYANTHNGGKLPGRVTTPMIEKYDTHIRAQEAAKAADAANAANSESESSADSESGSRTPVSRNARRNAAANAANASANGEVPANA